MTMYSISFFSILPTLIYQPFHIRIPLSLNFSISLTTLFHYPSIFLLPYMFSTCPPFITMSNPLHWNFSIRVFALIASVIFQLLSSDGSSLENGCSHILFNQSLCMVIVQSWVQDHPFHPINHKFPCQSNYISTLTTSSWETTYPTYA